MPKQRVSMQIKLPFLSKEKGYKVTITNISLRFMGAVHGIPGITSEKQVFYLNIPFQNKMGSNLLPSDLKGPSMTIKEIKVGLPFKLLDTSPQLPAEVPFMGKTVFRLKVEGPSVNYEGPMSITMNDEPADNIGLNIRSIVISKGNKRVALENSSMRLSLQKGQIFKTELQMYNILQYNDKISRIKVTPPFTVESTDPMAPTTLDKKDSYIMKIYVKAPDSNYTGDLEIIVE